jgi:CHAD domain-containing protein
MLDYLPPDGMTLEQAGDALARRLAVAAPGARELDRRFYDTFDGLLHGEGKVCVHEAGRLRLIEIAAGAELASAAMPKPTRPLQATELEDGPLRDRLQELISVRSLLPLAHVHARARAFSVLDELEKTVVRMTLEQPALVARSGPDRPLRPRLRLTAVRGYGDELRKLAHTVEAELGFKPVSQPLVDEAVRAAGLAPGGVSSTIDVALAQGERTDEAAATVLLALLDVIEANLDGTIADIDSEFLHDLRVAVRRTRAVQRELRHAFPPTRLSQFRTEFRWLQQATGEARDLDVHVLEFDGYRSLVPEPMRADLDPLLDVLRDRRLQARAATATALRSQRTTTLLGTWRVFLAELAALEGADRPDAARPIETVAARRIAKVYRHMVKMGCAIDRTSPAEHYHELRKKGKELRYLLELFGVPLFAADVVKPMIKTLKGLQDVLGRHQDREVQTAVLRSMRDDVAARSAAPAALMAMGVLVARLRADEHAAREEFAGQFETFAAKAQRAMMKETFG